MAGTMTSIRINTRLVDEAARVLGAKSRTDAVRMVLRRFKKLLKKHTSKLEFAGHDR